MTKVTHLVLGGGGVKGFATLGVLNKLIENNALELNKLRVIAGSSVGAIIGLLLVCGYKPLELFNQLKNFDVKQFLEPNIEKLITHFGIDTGAKIVSKIKDLISFKNINPDITFIRLYNITKIKLIITATSLNKRTVKYFDYIQTPNYKVIDVVRASFGIPILMTTVKDGEEHFVDGGLVDNFPLHLFSNVHESSIIAIKFVKTKDLPETQQFTKINNITDVFFANISCILEELEYLRSMLHPKAYNKSTVLVNTLKYHMLSFDINENDKQELFNIGESSALDYINSKKYLLVLVEQLPFKIQNKIWKYCHQYNLDKVHTSLTSSLTSIKKS